jgi:cystathionine beta-lyase/cystathionine gamma-synthase
VHKLLTQEFDRVGIAVTPVDPLESRGWRKRLRKETRAIFLESPSSPTCRVIDLRPVNLLTKELGLALVVDSTFAGPVNFRPIEHGADVVIESNVILGSGPVIEEARDKMALWGQITDPVAYARLERDLETVAVRTARQNESAMRIAEWAAARKEIKRVHYPGLPSHEDHAIAKHHLHGFGAMLAIELAGDGRVADRFLRRLNLWAQEPKGGGNNSIATQASGLVRLIAGLEEADDLIADLEQALR